MTVAEILSAAMELTGQQRAEVIAKLVRSLELEESDKGLEQAWAEELDRRAAEIEQGRADWIDGEQLMQEFRKKYGRAV